MLFIDTTPASFTPRVTEADIQPRLGDLLKTAGWKVAANFKKVVFDAVLTNPVVGLNDSASIPIYVAEHFIYANKENKMFGVAVMGTWAQNLGQLRKMNKSPEPSTNGGATLEIFGEWATNEFRKYRSPQTLYIYMVEDLKGLIPNSPDIVLGWDTNSADTFKRAVLDIEVEASEWTGSPGIFRVSSAEGGRMQSPIMQAGLRTHLLENYYDEDYHYAIQNTNWWHDSEISIKGHLDETNLFFIVQCDNVPAPEGNLVPVIPLYFGKLDPLEEGDNAYALFTGSVPIVSTVGNLESKLEAIAKYDYDDTTKKTPNIMPLMKTYPKFPANGLDNVMVSRGKLGARYQAHYLSWNAPANGIEPARTSVDGRDYPRAWNNAENPLYKYSFNPSRYSQKVHTSKVYVIHPEEGVRGSLKGTIGLSAMSFNANKLRVKKTHCPEQFDVFRYFLVEGVSPLTKKPGTQYRPMGIGLYFNTVDDEGNEVTPPTP
ncbi:hypothetical protein SECTIM467_42 [Brevibacillus phage SecTim467]|uniref:Major virion structural protein n=2 Tax=Jenstvirus jenst TaxID=1982225 RepID=A0A0K2CP42_9CAUD|nr:virion structural protein [Brevibacillus phage Jenst]ALA07172.1 putative major virion structural protein [Brevibacillus phage Jenst]ALA07541.1 hypothetical protein SECTIM467_42 [Brevibacillus phage SecTim467]